MSSHPNPHGLATLEQLVALELPRLFAFSFHMCGRREDAERFLIELRPTAMEYGEARILSAPDPFEELLGVLARAMEDTLGRRSEHTFESLDTILRSDLTRPIDLRSSGFTDDPTQVHVLLWQLERTCLFSVLGCLPPGVRLSFVLTDLWGISPARSAELLGIKESAYRVRLTRGRKRVEDYLAPRCVHVDEQNPCTCVGRLMIALDARFISPPAHTLDIPHEPHDAKGACRDVGGLYRSLPPVQMTADDSERILSYYRQG